MRTLDTHVWCENQVTRANNRGTGPPWHEFKFVFGVFSWFFRDFLTVTSSNQLKHSRILYFMMTCDGHQGIREKRYGHGEKWVWHEFKICRTIGCDRSATSSDIMCVPWMCMFGMKIRSWECILAAQELSGEMLHSFLAFFRGLRARARGGCDRSAPSSDIMCVPWMCMFGVKIRSFHSVAAVQELSGVNLCLFLTVFDSFWPFLTVFDL